ncbi:MAG: hypothetical protein D6725_14020 [Planctomycetota bacterium]|nr:MAG: hypothetical protein D6725_14020 [Planctomycetota bacterium]
MPARAATDRDRVGRCRVIGRRLGANDAGDRCPANARQMRKACPMTEVRMEYHATDQHTPPVSGNATAPNRESRSDRMPRCGWWSVLAVAMLSSAWTMVSAQDRPVDGGGDGHGEAATSLPLEPGARLESVRSEFGLADGPAWDGTWSLFVPDVRAQKLYRFVPAQNRFDALLKQPVRISATFFNLGRLYAADNGNARIARWQGGPLETLAQLRDENGEPLRPNDLVVDHHGGVYVTVTRPGRVLYVSPSGDVRTAVEHVETANGIILSPDESTLYVAAYVPKQIWAYPVTEPGRTAAGKLFAKMNDGPARGADGMTVDRAGNVYCAGADSVWVWDPNGRLLGRIRTPQRPINATFGDPDMRSLYITGFGGLWRQRMRVYGRNPHPPARLEDIPRYWPPTRPKTVIPETVRAFLDVPYARYGTRKVLCDVFVPAEALKRHDARRPAIVVVHGGGWKNGDKTKFRALAVQLARRGYVTAAIEYRLAYEARFPAAIHDCNAAVRFLRANAAQFRIDPDRIGAVGGSAGGHLVGLMAAGFKDRRLQGNGGNAEYSSRLQAAVVMAGPLQIASGDVAERSRSDPKTSNAVLWFGGTVDQVPELYRLADAYEHIGPHCPPILFMVGEHDHPERNEPARRKLREAGVWTDVKVYKDGKHGCWNRLPWFEQMVADMDAFFRMHLNVNDGE